MVVPTLFDELATLSAQRSSRGCRHPHSAVLGLVTLTMMFGRASLIGVARFGRQHGVALAHVLGFRRTITRSASKLSRTLRRFDAVDAVLSRWVKARIDPAHGLSSFHTGQVFWLKIGKKAASLLIQCELRKGPYCSGARMQPLLTAAGCLY